MTKLLIDHGLESLYVIGVILCIYPVGLLVLSTYPGDKSDTLARGLSFLTGACLAAVWPIALVGFLAYKLSQFLWGGIMGRDKAQEKQRL